MGAPCADCTLLYRVLYVQWDNNRRIDISQARSNYKLIMRRIHTDKNSSPDALLASQCVTIAWRLINDPSSYGDYVAYGSLGVEESLCPVEFERAIAFIGSAVGFVIDSNPTPPETPSMEPDTGANSPIVVIDISDDDDDDNDARAHSSHDKDTYANNTDHSSDPECQPSFVSGDQACPASALPDRDANDRRQEPTANLEHPFEPSPDESAPRRQSYNDGVPLHRIVDHRDRSSRLKFKVAWCGLNMGDVWEPYEVIKAYPAALRDYLKYLRDSKRKRLLPLMRKHPYLVEFLK